MARTPKADTDAATTTQDAPKLTRLEAVRRAVADGADKPSEGVLYVRDKFGFEMTNQQFSSNKNLLKGRSDSNGNGKAHTNGKVGRPKAAVEVAPAPREVLNATTQGVGNPGPVHLARMVKELVGQYGAEPVREMVGLFGA